MLKKTIIVDGMNLLFRGFYGVPETVVNSSGDKINAIYGFFSLLRRVIIEINPKFLVIIFDSETSSDYKKQINSQYKANRINIDENIFYQLAIIQKSLDLMNIFWVEEPKHEADDIIGSYAKKFSKNDIISYITSNDNDFLQLLDPKIQIIKGIRGENVLCNQDYFSKKFDIEISQYLEYMALVGDSSDNILGVKGIGKKRASQLLNIYSNIDNVYKSFDKLSPHLKKVLFNQKDEILGRRDFFRINNNIDVSFDLNKFVYKKESLPDKMGEFLKVKLAFTKIIMKSAVFFLTYDGYYNFTSGIGTQTQIFLQGINFYKDKYFEEYGEFEVNIIVPNFDKTSYGYNETNIKFCNEILNNFNGNIFVVESEIDKADTKFWTVGNWEKICKASAEMISKVSYKYKKCIVITVDPPFLQTSKYFEKDSSNFKFISLMYTSTFIHDQKVLQDRFLWEYEGFQMANINNNLKIGNVCNYLTNHFIQKYSLKKLNFIDYSSSLFLESNDFKYFSEDEILDILKKYNIPLDKKIIFAFGRASWVKGFDTLLKSYPFIKTEIHIVLLASQFEEIYSDYEKIINKFKIKCTLIRDFSRELPKALCQYEECRIVVIPSIREPFSNIPFEVSLWSKSNGPIILTSDLESFKEQIRNGYNGFNFIRSDFKDLAMKIDFILNLPQKNLNIIRKNAYKKVVSERNFYLNFKNILDFGFAQK